MKVGTNTCARQAFKVRFEIIPLHSRNMIEDPSLSDRSSAMMSIQFIFLLLSKRKGPAIDIENCIGHDSCMQF